MSDVAIAVNELRKYKNQRFPKKERSLGCDRIWLNEKREFL